MSAVREARRALGRGDDAAALVLLWNELEPARLSGNRGRLTAIGGLARRIAEDGDEAEQREAGRLLEEVQSYLASADADVAATARLDADVTTSGGGVPELPGGDGAPVPGDLDEVEGVTRRGNRIGTIIWLLVFGAIVLMNALRGTGD